MRGPVVSITRQLSRSKSDQTQSFQQCRQNSLTSQPSRDSRSIATCNNIAQVMSYIFALSRIWYRLTLVYESYLNFHALSTFGAVHGVAVVSPVHSAMQSLRPTCKTTTTSMASNTSTSHAYVQYPKAKTGHNITSSRHCGPEMWSTGLRHPCVRSCDPRKEMDGIVPPVTSHGAWILVKASSFVSSSSSPSSFNSLYDASQITSLCTHHLHCYPDRDHARSRSCRTCRRYREMYSPNAAFRAEYLARQSLYHKSSPNKARCTAPRLAT
jgi:hypothetical protein